MKLVSEDLASDFLCLVHRPSLLVSAQHSLEAWDFDVESAHDLLVLRVVHEGLWRVSRSLARSLPRLRLVVPRELLAHVHSGPR